MLVGGKVRLREPVVPAWRVLQRILHEFLFCVHEGDVNQKVVCEVLARGRAEALSLLFSEAEVVVAGALP